MYLHPQQGEDDYEEEEQEQERRYGLDRVEKRGHEVGQGAPIPARKDLWSGPDLTSKILRPTS